MNSFPLRPTAWVVAAATLSLPSCVGKLDRSSISNEGRGGMDAAPGSGPGASSSPTASDTSGSGGPAPDSSPPAPATGGACWDNQLPTAVQPILPTASVPATCAAAPTIAQWNAPAAGVMSDAEGGIWSPADARAVIVGRWVACSSNGAFTSTPHAGVEFGANGRWRLLVADGSGALVPAAPTGGDASFGNPTSADDASQGRYYALAGGQLDLWDDGIDPLPSRTIALSPDGNALHFPQAAGSPPAGVYYARTSPSPNEGNDNPPSTTDGKCSMVGTWDLAMTSQSPAATFSFDAVGNFVGGPPGSDLCASHTMYGTYQLSPGMFELTENIGMGICTWWDWAAYPASFDATCTHLSLTEKYDGCTGGRGYFNGPTTLTKRP